MGVPFTLTAPVEIPKNGAEGVIFALGGDAAGWSLFLWEGKARFHYNFFGLERTDVVSKEKLAPGKHTIEVAFTPDSPKPGHRPPSASQSTEKRLRRAASTSKSPMRCGTETMDVGMDCVSPVCHDYEKKGLFPFTGTIESVTFEFGDVKEPTAWNAWRWRPRWTDRGMARLRHVRHGDGARLPPTR